MSKQTTRRFHIGAILSITTDRLLAPNGMDDVYAILDFLTGQSLFTHQLPRAAREVREGLLAQVPALRDVTAAEVTPANWRARLRRYERRYGTWHDLQPIPGRYRPMNPVAELQGMAPDAEVIVVTPTEPTRC